MSVWFDSSHFENWFIDHRGGVMGLFTHNRFVRLPASASLESDSSDEDNDDGFHDLRYSANWNPASPPVTDNFLASGSTSAVALTSTPLASTSSIRPPSVDSVSSKATITVSAPSLVAMDTSSLMGIDSSSLLSPSEVPSPAAEVTISSQQSMELLTDSTVTVSSTGLPQLPVLTYGDVRSHLPHVTTFESLITASEPAQPSSQMTKLMLGFARETSKLSSMTPHDPVSLTPKSSSSTGASSPASYRLGAKAIGNLSTSPQQLPWSRQSAEEILKGTQSQSLPVPRHGRSRHTLSKNKNPSEPDDTSAVSSV